jgi:predicted enzyme related to lactoylglutathione lyase
VLIGQIDRPPVASSASAGVAIRRRTGPGFMRGCDRTIRPRVACLRDPTRHHRPMHRSRLAAFVIDCKSDDVDVAAAFWSQALGRAVVKADPNDPGYRELASEDGEPVVLVQRVDHDSRIHLDIEADDLEAEAKRLEALGARRVAFVKRWWVMEAPTGQRFCIVNPQRGPLAGKANEHP